MIIIKTREFKLIVENHAYKYVDRHLGFICIYSEDKLVATVSTNETADFTITQSRGMGRAMISKIIEYAYTPTDEREEECLNIDIPLSDWKEITKGFDSESNRVNNSVTATFKGNNGIDSFFEVIKAIQAKYVEYVGYEATYDEVERKNTSH